MDPRALGEFCLPANRYQSNKSRNSIEKMSQKRRKLFDSEILCGSFCFSFLFHILLLLLLLLLSLTPLPLSIFCFVVFFSVYRCFFFLLLVTMLLIFFLILFCSFASAATHGNKPGIACRSKSPQAAGSWGPGRPMKRSSIAATMIGAPQPPGPAAIRGSAAAAAQSQPLDRKPRHNHSSLPWKQKKKAVRRRGERTREQEERADGVTIVERSIDLTDNPGRAGHLCLNSSAGLPLYPLVLVCVYLSDDRSG